MNYCGILLFNLGRGIKHSLILSDSMTRGFRELRRTDVVCRRGADPQKLGSFLRMNMSVIKKYHKVIVLHIGTNYFSKKEEWGKYLELVNGQCSLEEYSEALNLLNPTPSKGSIHTFEAQVREIISIIRKKSNAIILISGILPRPWDNDRRGDIIDVYNRNLKALTQPSYGVHYINTPKLFMSSEIDIVGNLFCWDGLHLNREGYKLLQSFFGERIWSFIASYYN